MDTPLLLALCVSAVGIAGVIAAVIAGRGVQVDLMQVNRFDDVLRQDFLEHVSAPEFRIRNWIKEKDFAIDSHLADQLIAVHSGWTRKRAPALSELHNLSNRRERSRFSARLAGGIAATLLICGIGGTLLSVHPILQAFKIVIDSNGAVQEASESARDVVAMMHGLGRAFYPSLAALLWTVAVVTTRGLYVQKTMRLARALDSLAFDYFLLEFSPRTLSEDFADLSARLSDVADTMSERDTAFAKTAESLAKSIEQIKLLGPVVQKAGEDASQASSKLAKDTNNVVSAFAKHLAEGSPLFTAVEQLKESVGTTDLSVNQLTEVAQELTVTNRETAEMIAKLAIALKEAIDGVPEVIRVASENGAKEIGTASVALSSRAKETTNALIERLEKLLDATTKKIETTKTDISQIAPAIDVDLDKRIKTSFGGLISAVSQSTNDLNAATSLINQAAQKFNGGGPAIHDLRGSNEGLIKNFVPSKEGFSTEPVQPNAEPRIENTTSSVIPTEPTRVTPIKIKPAPIPSGTSKVAKPQTNGGRDDNQNLSWRGKVGRILRLPFGNGRNGWL
jgi:hypothetical protein